MKKSVFVLFVAVLGIMAIPAHAQLKFGIKGGANISKVSINKEVLNSDNVTGFNIGPMIEFTVPLVGVGMDVALLYSQRGVETLNETMKTSYLDVPVNFKWKFGIPLVKAYLAAGPYASFRIGGDKFWEIPHHVGEQLKAKNFGAGLNFGAGVELLSHLQVGFNYGLGLTNDYEALTAQDAFRADGKSRGWSINAAIIF
ncbi:porin family protein [Parabacteroides pacaensis]|uniref:porin family protein n=1 Tax=Parabacteroides pacaensis TaxID=2086575 RepID=UPI000D0FE95B|nr:porin family protein [Parabacteroides pacaensis]